jgi:hypothetical protein
MEFKIIKDNFYNNIIIGNENIMIKFYKNREEKKDELKFFNRLDKLNIDNICKKVDISLSKKDLIKLYDNNNSDTVSEIISLYNCNNYLVFPNYGMDLNKLSKDKNLPDIDIMYEGLHKITNANEKLIHNQIVYADFKPDNITYDKDTNEFYLIDYGITYFLDEKLVDVFNQPINLFNTFFLYEPYLYFGPEIYILSFNNYFKKQDRKKENVEYKFIRDWKKYNKGKWFDELYNYFNPSHYHFIYLDCVSGLESKVYKKLVEIFNLDIVKENIKKLIMYTRHRSLFNPFEKLKKNFGMFGLGITYLNCAYCYESSDLQDMMIEEGKEIIIDSLNYSKYI